MKLYDFVHHSAIFIDKYILHEIAIYALIQYMYTLYMYIYSPINMIR